MYLQSELFSKEMKRTQELRSVRLAGLENSHPNYEAYASIRGPKMGSKILNGPTYETEPIRFKLPRVSRLAISSYAPQRRRGHYCHYRVLEPSPRSQQPRPTTPQRLERFYWCTFCSIHPASPPVRQSASPPVRQSASPPVRQSTSLPVRQPSLPVARQPVQAF